MKFFSGIFLIVALAVCGGCDDIAMHIMPGMADFNVEFCGGYSLWRTSASCVSINPVSWRSDKEIVPWFVVRAGHDDRFILAHQHPMVPRNLFEGDTFTEPDFSRLNYWIIDTSVKVVLGPFDEAEFSAKRLELGVPDTIEMLDVPAWREEGKKRAAKESAKGYDS